MCGDSTSISQIVGTDTNAYLISGNLLLLSMAPDMIDTVVTPIYNYLATITYTPCKLPMIVNGRLNKFFEEVCLVDQSFIKENKMKVSKYVESKNSNIIKFIRYEVGEGIEKKEENFADEVMKQMNA